MATTPNPDDELLPEYDLSQLRGGVRGKYYERFKAHPILVRLDPDLAKAFPTEASVNDALRLLLDVAGRQAEAQTSEPI